MWREWAIARWLAALSPHPAKEIAMLKQLIDAICFRLVNGPLPAPMPPFEIAKLDLKPGDYLAVTFPGKLSYEQVTQLRELFKKEILPRNKVLIFEGGARLAVISSDQAEAAAPHIAAA
jgi:hypothetical protein